MLEPLLPRLKREIEARLEELRPVLREVAELEAAKQALLEEAAAVSRRGPVVAAERILPRRESASPALAERRAARSNGNGATLASEQTGDPQHAAIVSLVEERPGVSVAEIVSVTKLDKAVVAATVAKLKREGVLADEAGGVKLASRQPLTLAQIAAAMARGDEVDDAAWEAARPTPAGAAA